MPPSKSKSCLAKTNPNPGKAAHRKTSRRPVGAGTEAEQARLLLKPEEVLTLNPDYLIAFVRGMNPLLAKRVKWYADPAFGTALSRLPAMWWLLLATCIGAIVLALSYAVRH